MTWVAHLVRTMDGARGARLDLSTEGGWEIPLNGIEEFSVTVGKRQLLRLDPLWWKPWRVSVAVSWQKPDGTLDAWVAGPITNLPTGETRTTATFPCRGIGAILARRNLTAQEPINLSTAAQVEMMTKSLRYVGMSLGTIGQEVVKRGMAKVGGTLPIVFGSPREHGSTLNERTYDGYNLANNQVWKRLTELSGVRNGPDIAFRPRWRDDGSLEWVMVHGTRAQPQIAQTWAMDLDTTSHRSPIASVHVTTDASRLATRVYWTGAGEGSTTMVRVAEDRSRLEDQMPMLETVGSTSDSDSRDQIRDHALGELAAAEHPVTQIDMRVNGADPRSEIGRWRVGDAARVTMGDGWLTVPAGTTSKRIIAARGDWSNGMVDLSFQDDAVHGPDDYLDEERIE